MFVYNRAGDNRIVRSSHDHEHEPGCITRDRDVCQGYAADVSGLHHVPDGVARPESEAEIVDLLRFCHLRAVPVTAQGLRSSTTGAAVATKGIVLSLERLNRLISIDKENQTALAQPGIITADFKRQVAAAGLFYPPDPTSEEECTIGGNVACNASGARSYKYGPTRRYVRALRLVSADGTVKEVRRIGTRKNAAGYFGLQNPIDLWVGSEGTLGIITQVELDLLPAEKPYFGAMAFFPDWRGAIEFVIQADKETGRENVSPRCLEYYDANALALIRPEKKGMEIPEDTGAAIWFEEEMGEPENWIKLISSAGGKAESTLIAQTTKEKDELRRLRHAVPEGMNERGQQAGKRGGRRVSTDFAVPLVVLPQLMEEVYKIISAGFNGFSVAYGHVGDGHPHFNLLAEDKAGLDTALEVALTMTQTALALGGTLSAEHGLGKLKAPLYEALYPAWMTEVMTALKVSLDPKGILAPGNLISPQETK